MPRSTAPALSPALATGVGWGAPRPHEIWPREWTDSSKETCTRQIAGRKIHRPLALVAAVALADTFQIVVHLAKRFPMLPLQRTHGPLYTWITWIQRDVPALIFRPCYLWNWKTPVCISWGWLSREADARPCVTCSIHHSCCSQNAAA